MRARRRALLGLLAPLLLSCGGARREVLITYFNADHLVSVRYPPSWKTEQAEQQGIWYRYFLGPPTGPQNKPAVSVTLLSGPLPGTLDEYAQAYLAGNPLISSSEVARQGATGKHYAFRSSDGATRYSLLLLQDRGTLYGLYSQGDPEQFESRRALLQRMEASLTLERPELYPRERNQKFGFAIRVPPSWKSQRSLSGREMLLRQFTSPPLGVDQNLGTVHASLTITVESAGDEPSIESFYNKVHDRLGEAYRVLEHRPWRGGYADELRAETPMAASLGKRFYRVSGGRGYTLSCEARDDVFHRVSRWCDLIAGTFEVGPEVKGE